jgi:TolB-like protein
MIGQAISHYRIIEKIGAGGMGEVYRARDEHLDRDVAIKVLPPGTLGDESARRRFHREALALSKLNHPNIATIHDFDTRQGVDFLVMEYIPGITLSEKLANRPLPEKEIINLGTQLAEGLSAAHEHGVVHRDLKPGNLRLTGDGKLKILDFGLARLRLPVTESAATESMSETQAMAGTLPYMAPEQILGGEIDARTDIHAAGSVLYETATGKRPFADVGGSQLIGAILRKPPLPPTALNPKLSPELERIIGKCLEKEPENRYQSAKELAIDLRRLSPSLPQVETTVPRALTRRWLLAVVGLLLVAAVAAIAVWQRRRITRTPVAQAAKPSAAVLPFKNLSADPENEYFSDGMTEEIITKLSRIPGLAVASRTSVARFKNTQKDIKEIGRELGVRYVLEGSVRKAGNRVRITAQLIDSETGFHLWAEDFDRNLKDIFALQDETALKIAGALNLQLTPQEQQAVQHRYTDKPEAYDAYLRGEALIQYFSNPEKLQAARRHYKQALQADPSYAPALAGLASVEAQYYRNLEPTQAHLRLAEELAQQALALDPELSRAHVAMGEVYGMRYDYAHAAEEIRQGIRTRPDNAWAWDVLSWVLGYQQPPDAQGAEQAGREAIRLEPNFPGAFYHLGRALLLQKRYQEAITNFDHASELDPAFVAPQAGLSEVYLAQGNTDRALAVMEKVLAVREVPIMLVRVSWIYAVRGEKEEALAELEKALRLGYRDFAALDASPYFSSLRSDPRFIELVSRYRKQQN